MFTNVKAYNYIELQNSLLSNINDKGDNNKLEISGGSI